MTVQNKKRAFHPSIPSPETSVAVKQQDINRSPSYCPVELQTASLISKELCNPTLKSCLVHAQDAEPQVAQSDWNQNPSKPQPPSRLLGARVQEMPAQPRFTGGGVVGTRQPPSQNSSTGQENEEEARIIASQLRELEILLDSVKVVFSNSLRTRHSNHKIPISANLCLHFAQL